MKNLRLNFGAVFGGLVGAGAVIAILVILSNGGFPRRGLKLVVLAAFGGAALGNWIWSLAQPDEPQEL
jgi:hypothetical protein